MRVVAAGVMAVAALALAGPAKGFCRSTTSAVPTGYNPVSSGCWRDGTPLAWSVTRVPYGVASGASTQVDYASASHIADLAFAAWTGTECTGSLVGIEAYDVGPLTTVEEASDCTTSTTCDPEKHDVIEFDDATWPHDDPANTLALTTVTYGVDDGHIFEAYTEVNTAQHEVTTQEPPPAGGAYDLQAILTHEAGHFLGLAHATDTTSVMYAFYQPGVVQLRSDDVQGICTVYPPPAPTGGGGCSAAPAGSRGVGAAVVALLLVGLGAGARRRSRPGRRAVP